MDVRIISAITGAVGIGIGFAMGYTVTKKRLESEYREVLDKEIAATHAYYLSVSKADYPTADAAVRDLIEDKTAGIIVDATEALRTYRGGGMSGRVAYDKIGREDIPAPKTLLVFDYEAEKSRRTRNEPFIITADEYEEGEHGYAQTQLTYYLADETLAEDGSEDVIEDIVHTIGANNLQRMGHGSNDPHVVYVRNMYLQQDFEITEHGGAYAEVVLGVEGRRTDGGDSG